VHDDTVVGIGPLRAWIIEHADDDVVFMVDDDVSGLYSLVGTHRRRMAQPADILRVVENTAHCAAGAGARVFGFSQSWDVRKFMPQKPVCFTGWVGGAIGIIGRPSLYDRSLLLRADIDACLTSLLKHRIIYRDDRFGFEHRRFGGSGGNAASRSSAQHERELAYLLRKWGAHLKVQPAKSTIRLIVDVQRSVG